MSKRDGTYIINQLACWLAWHDILRKLLNVLPQEHGGGIEQPVLDTQD